LSTNSVSGLISGIDTTALIDSMVTSRSGPILLLQQRQAQKTAQLSAWKSFEAILISLNVETDRLAKSALWDTPSVTSGNEEILRATATSSAALGSYDFWVEQLAQAHQIRSASYSARTDLVGSGTLSVTVGTRTTDLDVAAGTTLDQLAEQINGASVGATATVIRSDDGTAESYTLVLTSDATGTAQAISVTSALTGGTDPVLDTEVRAARNAIIRVGSETGLQVESSTNTFRDIVSGVDLTVHARSDPGELVSVTVARDTASLEESVATFVERYNAMIGFVNGQFKFDPEVGQRPPLMGSGTLTAVAGQIRRMVTAPIGSSVDGSIVSLFGAGIRSGADGKLTFDREKFQGALEADFGGVANLFRANATFDTSGISWLSAPPDVSLAGRQMEIVVEQAATRATLLGASLDVGAGVVIDASNDRFRVEIDGIQSGDLALAHGTYVDGDALAAAVQSAIENDDKLGALSAQVSFEDEGGGAGRLVLTSNRYGSAGTLQLVAVANSSLATDLGLSSVFGTEEAGRDVAGTIDGIRAEGNGQTLRVPDDEEGIGGTSFLVTLDAVPAAVTLTASFTEGLGRTVSRSLVALTDASEGRLSRVGESIERQITTITRDIAGKQEALERYRAQLVRKYARLESTLGQLQSQGNYVAAQISAASGSGGFGVNNR
jgi:flagellar hook-associated protein 2